MLLLLLGRNYFQDSTFEMGHGSLYRFPGIRETLHGSYPEPNGYFSIIVCVCKWFSVNLNVTGFCQLVTLKLPDQQKKIYKKDRRQSTLC